MTTYAFELVEIIGHRRHASQRTGSLAAWCDDPGL